MKRIAVYLGILPSMLCALCAPGVGAQTVDDHESSGHESASSHESILDFQRYAALFLYA